MVNIVGLALGLSCFTIIMLYVENELSYDKFHHNPENIVGVVKDFVDHDGTRIPDATTPPALAKAIREELPDAAYVTRFFPTGTDEAISLVIALVTISIKSIRGALANPIDSLKIE
jgi:hypothetical protein